ncbi:MAG TPA: hypothetical protein VFW40_09135 [Capsulimonadaceae bacterium]|nr:hypothetical protein [Capsulimonadaceae bacterium]
MPDRDNKKGDRRELPMAPEPGELLGNGSDDGWTYICYGERGEDVAFEISDNLEEAVEIFQSMQDDGFSTRLYQAHELQVVAEGSRH